MNIIGANPAATIVSTSYQSDGKAFGLGDRYVDHQGKEFIYVQAAAAITGAGYVVYFDTSYQATMLSTANDALGNLVGVPGVAFALADYGWVQIKGPADAIRVAASCAANVRLNTTATGGQLDDDGTTGAMEVRGIVITAANGGSAGTVAGVLNYPAVSVTL